MGLKLSDALLVPFLKILSSIWVKNGQSFNWLLHTRCH